MPRLSAARAPFLSALWIMGTERWEGSSPSQGSSSEEGSGGDESVMVILFPSSQAE